MKLSIIIVNYNVRYFLEQCIQSVQRAITSIPAEVFVVDNNSSDSSAEFIEERFPWVKLIANKENTGFSKANNQAISVATGEYILLLNPDTVVAEDTFEKCVAFMNSNLKAGGLGVKMVDGKGVFLPESKRSLPTPLVAFYKMFGLSTLFPKSKTFGKYHLGYLSENETHEVEILSGAFMFMRKTVLDEIGLLDESFFMYGEDVDLSYRIVKAGYQNFYFPESTIIHYKGESTKRGSLNYVRVFYNAMILFSRKHFSPNRAGLFTLLINMGVVFRGLMTLLMSVFSSNLFFLIDALISFIGIYFIKTFWATNIKDAGSFEYYPKEFLFIAVPVYLFIWLLFVYFSGGYDKPFRLSNLMRGLFTGTIIISALYGFLPETWRFSRALILLGAVWTGVSMMLTRLCYHYLRFGELSLERDEQEQLIIAGIEEESLRALNLLRQSGIEADFIGFVSPQNSPSPNHLYLGNTRDLPKITRVFNPSEIIFAAKEIPYKTIIQWIVSLGVTIQYKIINPDSDSFVGSNSKNAAGDLYAADKNLSLTKPLAQRRKRVFDAASSFIMLPFLPILVFIIPVPSRFVANLFSVLIGKKTWVGYDSSISSSGKILPILSEGVLTAASLKENEQLQAAYVAKLNLLYAKNYTVMQDLNILLKCYRKLGT